MNVLGYHRRLASLEADIRALEFEISENMLVAAVTELEAWLDTVVRMRALHKALAALDPVPF